MRDQCNNRHSRRRVPAAVAAILVFLSSFSNGFSREGQPDSEMEVRSAISECEAPIRIKHDKVICLSGSIDQTMMDEFVNGLSDKTKFVFIRSQGGEVLAAIDIGFAIFHRHLDVIIKDMCLSSCANYIFLGANNKFLIGNAVVGWHGSPETMVINWDKYSKEWQDALHEMISRNKLFFFELALIGVKQGLVDVPPPSYKPRGPGVWSYRDDILSSRFGVRNIYRLPF